MQKTFRFLITFLFAILCVGAYLIAEEITLTTYYPAPYGNYEELRASKLAVGSAETMPASDGDLNAAGTIDASSYSVSGDSGDSGIFTTLDGKTVTVENGIITDITP